MTKRMCYRCYTDHYRVCLGARQEIDQIIHDLAFALMRSGVSYNDGGNPMRDVDRITIEFRDNGVFSRPTVSIAGRYPDGHGCPVELCFEPYPDEEEEEA